MISTRSSHKGRYKIMQGPLRGVQQDLCKIFSEGPVQNQARPPQRISAGSAQDLVIRTRTRKDVTRISTRPLRRFHQDHFVPACTIKMHMGISQEPFDARIYRKNVEDQSRRAVCASQCSRNAHGHVTRAMSYENLQAKCRVPDPRPTFCASLHSRT